MKNKILFKTLLICYIYIVMGAFYGCGSSSAAPSMVQPQSIPDPISEQIEIASSNENDYNLGSGLQDENAYNPKDEKYSINAVGPFSEGLAFAKIRHWTYGKGYDDDRSAYINTNGEVVFYLPNDLPYGDEFHEGYAVISDFKETSHPIDRPNLAFSDRRYALIDKYGNIKIMPDKYNFIGRQSESLLLTSRLNKGYNGTEYEIAFRDIDENVAFSIYKSDDSSNNTYIIEDIGETYFKNGVVQVHASKDSLVSFYDTKGQMLHQGNYLKDHNPFFSDAYFSPLTNYFLYTSNSNNTIQVYNRYSGEISQFEFNMDIKCAPTEFINNLNVLVTKNAGIYVIDIEGNIVSKNTELHVEDIYITDQSLWIVKLQNNYYGVIDGSASLQFEPIRSELHYIGEDIFYSFDTFYDINGDVILDRSGYNTALRSDFSDEYVMIGSGGDYSYMDKDGNFLSFNLNSLDSPTVSYS